MSDKYHQDEKYHYDKNWERGPVTGRWYLRRAVYASVYREIEDAKKRRREDLGILGQNRRGRGPVACGPGVGTRFFDPGLALEAKLRHYLCLGVLA